MNLTKLHKAIAEKLCNENNIEKIETNVAQMTIENVNENINEDIFKLKKAAQKFLNSYKGLEQSHQSFSAQQLKSLLNAKDDNDLSFISYLGGGQETYYTRAKYLLAFEFDEALNEYLGGLPKKGIYVYVDSEGKPVTYEMSMENLAKYANAKGILLISKKALDRGVKENNLSILDGQDSKINKSHLNVAQKAYLGVSNRIKNSPIAPPDAPYLLMWKEKNDWKVSTLLNKGDLKEAYVAALMEEHQKKCLCSLIGGDVGNNPYYSHKLISTFFNKYIYNVTNMPAIVEEDIISSFYGAQYAVKGSTASLPGLEQYLKAASFIISSNFKSKKDIDNYLEKQVRNGHRNHIIKVLENESSIVAQGFLELKRMNININI